jgi:ribosome biogenesis protein NSA1
MVRNTLGWTLGRGTLHTLPPCIRTTNSLRSTIDRRMYSCTSNGALRLTTLASEGDAEHNADHQLAALPTRLTQWRLASNEQTFSYAGDEVELSVWDTERAFSSSARTTAKNDVEADSASKKRKRNEQLLPGELWRAKNVSTLQTTSLTDGSQTLLAP